MARYLALFTDNYNDGFDVHGFKIMTDKEQSRFEELATSITWEFEFDTNSETLNYSNGEELLSRIEFKEISKAEYDILEKVFGDSFGTFIGEEYLATILHGDTDDEMLGDEDDY